MKFNLQFASILLMEYSQNNIIIAMSKLKRKDQSYDYLVKLIIIGDSGVGKTNILMRFCEHDFKNNYVATIGVDFKVKTIQVDDKRFKLQIWDTAGQERFKNITQTYYKGAVGIILAYSVTDENTFNNIEKWINQINESTKPDVKKILVANKSDMSEDRKVSTQRGEKLAQKYGIPFVECSAKTGDQVQEIFHILGKGIKQQFQKDNYQMGLPGTQISKGNKQPNKGKDCAC